ncbi:M23 family metallopeptidase [Herbiconiux sp. CPCC 203407]|uniref:M23 family metallopeptidase n=1 Tax=Herbiconiux oxytropis TaxID=2970915 RepID=A0AA42BVL2_9MICO|nr:M23 family metallopeptidase [Herbiconiux oxytropis]MCS5723822.1 M23 family metallopeptidase [Herbiconiux oxytropis]MCS5726604.1 M23 family metallopeptidase [Herbiconiux oxytropis]
MPADPTVSARRAARLAAASTIAAPRPHAQPLTFEQQVITVEGTVAEGDTAAARRKAGRRAAAAFSDSIERPSGGRRAIVPVATTVVPIEPLDEVAIVPAADSAPALAPVVSKPVSRRSLRTASPAVPVADAPSVSAAPAASGASVSPTGRRSRRGPGGSGAKGAFSIIAMLFATGIAVATTMPATALHAASGAPSTSAETVLADVAPLEAQELTTSSDVVLGTVARDGYGVTDPRILQAAARASGMRVADTFSNNPVAAVQWPFPVGVPISSRFGPRESPGGIGSTDHKGVDFTPGEGTIIQSIADGVVREVVPNDNGGLGVHVIVDHVVNGQAVSSVYGHMLTGSIEVEEGQVIKVTQALGRVGNTGTSTGAHLHLEIRLDGTTPVDPFAWLEANAG